MAHPKTDAVAARAASQLEATLARLGEYLRFPAISSDPAHAGDVRALAERIAKDLDALGFANARVLEVAGALPAVAAEWMKAPGKPTIVVYGHLDLQPVKNEPWDTDPHTLVKKGDRVYARGSADDMGGWVSHLGAIAAWLDVAGELPCNIKLFIEGEEEIGSPNLEAYMDAFPDAFAADVMILTDCENPSPTLPGLTVSLRGLLELEITCESLKSDVHSGLWGNLLPDPSIALMMLVSRLVDADGRLALGRQEVPAAWREDAWNVPLTDDVIRSAGRLIDGVDRLPDHGKPPAEWIWRQPAVTVLSTSLPQPGHEKNAIRTKASAVLSFRVAPGQTGDELYALVEKVLTTSPPGGVKLTITRRGKPGHSWLYTPKGPAFEAADRAYERAWGRGLLQIGVGGTIPFVALFGRRFGDLPLILNGVMDPETGAHGPNESMHLGVFEKAILANVHLYAELGAVESLAKKG
ncbi:MAG: M20/M25/M40 family metallo-hydrolase [Sandaracinaceae bacterium]|nr:M20/M25/M40 family metallo-hydrolase [Sandaracinaceae bacterium]